MKPKPTDKMPAVPNRCEKCGRGYYECNPTWKDPRCLDAKCHGRIVAVDGGPPVRRTE